MNCFHYNAGESILIFNWLSNDFSESKVKLTEPGSCRGQHKRGTAAPKQGRLVRPDDVLKHSILKGAREQTTEESKDSILFWNREL